MEPDPLDHSPETRALLERFRGGAGGAAPTVFDAYRAQLARMVDHRLEGELRRRVSASDVVQEALMEAARRFEEYLSAPTMSFHLWLRLLTRQTLAAQCRHHIQAECRDVRREAPPDPGPHSRTSPARLAEALVADGTSPPDAAARDELRSLVEAALGRMDPLDREILVLRHFEGLSNAETAAEVGLSADAASKRHLRGLVRLKEILKLIPGGAAIMPGGG